MSAVDISNLHCINYTKVLLNRISILAFWGAKGAPILFSDLVFWLHVRIYISIVVGLHDCMIPCLIIVCTAPWKKIYIHVKMAAPWGSLTLLSYYSLCPNLSSHSID